HEGRQLADKFEQIKLTVSIHVPHTRDDFIAENFEATSEGFNPRPSHEGRLSRLLLQPTTLLFQSTSLTRGTTANLSKIFILLYESLTKFT
ncbi:MAG: hypothetical protein PUB37_00835, partial [Firmicutes bacterium]|nr:hypothetical protein [Bacillota bacterium]